MKTDRYPVQAVASHQQDGSWQIAVYDDFSRDDDPAYCLSLKQAAALAETIISALRAIGESANAEALARQPEPPDPEPCEDPEEDTYTDSGDHNAQVRQYRQRRDEMSLSAAIHGAPDLRPA